VFFYFFRNVVQKHENVIDFALQKVISVISFQKVIPISIGGPICHQKSENVIDFVVQK